MIRFSRLAPVAAAAFAGVLLMTAPASAATSNYIQVKHGDADYAWAQKDTNRPGFSRTRAVVKDGECDNHSVWAEYYRGGSNTKYKTYGKGCGTTSYGSWGGHKVWKIRVCEATKGCSAWKNDGS
ncbi:hypothetical protein ACFXKS_27155 [Streptomyces scopuliridis]|uniref:hypothetical protein n=1 Tax=Streptomyces scopuliridis TaxID=452529 RepID=UPI00369B0B22